MRKRHFISITFINLIVLGLLAILLFLILPPHIQKSLSTVLYLLAIVIGLIIGNLAARVYFLKQKMNQEKAEMLKTQKNIQTYIGNVVHDLRSPVATINMISELLESDLTEINPTHKELITSIKKSSTTMLDRICCILDNAHKQQNCIFDNMKAGKPHHIIQSTIDKLQILAIEKNIDIKLDLDPGLPDVYFDDEAIDSIFSNLISNAIKYSNRNTIISISNHLINNNVVYSVKDQGLGMNEDDLSKVFGRYTKLSARPTSGEDSSGLGLSIVKDLAEKMHGNVKAESEGKGKGSTFSVILNSNTNTTRVTARSV